MRHSTVCCSNVTMAESKQMPRARMSVMLPHAAPLLT